jgi:aspartate/methionine/tyrosine aminotransferase
VDQVVAEYQRRRDVIVDGLNAIPGITCQRPEGAFYVFPNIKALGKSSSDLADFILEKAGVSVLPGSSFGACGEGYLRLVYSNSMENILKAISQIKEAIELYL